MSEAKLPIETQIESEVLEEAIAYIQQNTEKQSDIPLFHSFNHTKEIVEIANTLAKKHNLKKDEREPLLLAAWFYFSGSSSDQKQFLPQSKKQLVAFLNKQEYPKEQIEVATGLLLPLQKLTETLLQKVLHDAIIAYTGRKRFFKKMELLRVERQNCCNRTYSDYDWETLTFKKLIQHNFLTDAARDKYENQKVKNISKQRNRVNEAYKVTTRLNTGKDLGRGVDTLYRTNYNNHINLSSIADGKANMMISINTLILSVIVTLSGAGFTFSGNYMVEHVRYTVPIFILLAGALASVVFAIISARPKVTSHSVSMEKVEKKKASLLFFGNFIQIPLNAYVEHLSNLKHNEQKLYDTMTVDIYYLGKVLDKKYRLLIWSYTIFMLALVLSVTSFFIIFFYTQVSG